MPATNDNLEPALAALTDWQGPPPALWRSALDQNARRARTFSLYCLRGLTAVAAAACLLLVFAAFVSSFNGSARSVSGAAMRRGVPTESKALLSPSAPEYRDAGDAKLVYSLPETYKGFADRSAVERVPTFDRADPVLDKSVQPRLVAHKAQLDLRTPDVRGTFSKLQFLINEAQGEFIEDSGISGDGASAQATVLLRVAAERLAQVLTEIRALGVVTSESVKGEDVTDQVVDIESRLRNERRIEQELLELVESRKDAQLKDILEVRSELSRVRQEIEKLVAQQDRLGRMVALASVLVVVHAEEEKGIVPADPQQSLWSQFLDRLDHAWKNGIRGLSASIAWILETAISGILWWAALLVAITTALAIRRRLRRAAAQEPAPST